MLRDEFKNVETQMRENLARARARFTHSGNKGASVEDAFRLFLKEYLPRRLAVGHGEVIDLSGSRSMQTDVVVVNEDHPFTFTENSPGLFLIEGVAAAGEVKAVLTTEHFQKSILSSRKFKTLKVEHSTGTTAMGTAPDLERYYKRPPWFLFAYESQLTLPSIHARLMKESQGVNGVEENLVDAVFVLGKGCVINLGDGQESLTVVNSEGTSISGWIWQQEESALFELMAWLSIVMPRVIRYDSILTPYLIPKGWR